VSEPETEPTTQSVVTLYLDEVPPPGWDAFAAGNESYFVANSWWAEVIEVGFGGEVLYGALLDESGEIVIAILGSERKTIGFRMLQSLFPYGGLIGDIKYGKQLFDLLVPALKARKYHMIVVEDRSLHVPDGLDVELSYGRRHLRDLRGVTSEDDLYAGYKQKSIRRNVRKARESGLAVTEARSREDIDAIFDLYRQAMTRNGAPTWYPKSLYMTVFERLVPVGRAKYRIVTRDGQLLGMMALLYSDTGAHYWMGGSSAEGLRLRVNDLLFHTALLEGIERGDEFFDAMGTGLEDEALATFKEKWGAVSQAVLGYRIEISPLRAKVFRFFLKRARTGLGARLVRMLRR
jgi:Acetyltransferase (GNAT) domain